MIKKLNYISLLILFLISISCKTEKKVEKLNSKAESEVKVDSVNAFDELANSGERKVITTSEYNTDNPEIENIERPGKPVFRNLEVDTTLAFGIWTKDPDGPHADFRFDAKSFYVVDYDGNAAMPYILDKNEITVFYNDFFQKGVITSTSLDSLKIKWENTDHETVYVKFEN